MDRELWEVDNEIKEIKRREAGLETRSELIHETSMENEYSQLSKS